MSTLEGRLSSLPRISPGMPDDGRGCRWPTHRGGEPETWLFCGDVRNPNTRMPYCVQHHFMAVRPPRERDDRE